MGAGLTSLTRSLCAVIDLEWRLSPAQEADALISFGRCHGSVLAAAVYVVQERTEDMSAAVLRPCQGPASGVSIEPWSSRDPASAG